MEFNFEDFKIQGIKFNYYFVCKRKLWLFDRGIAMENTSDRVMQGKTLHEISYLKEKNKEMLVDDMIRLDIISKDTVKEVKISSKMKDVDRMQILYYLFYLRQLGIEKKGTINYVKEKRVDKVELDMDGERELKNTLFEIKKLLEMKYPPKVEKLPYCKKCSYYEYCYIKEWD